MQRLGPQINPRPRRVVLQLQHLRCVDHLRIITLLPVSIQGWFPLFLLIDPPEEPLLEHRQRIGGGELDPQRLQVAQELTGRAARFRCVPESSLPAGFRVRHKNHQAAAPTPG